MCAKGHGRVIKAGQTSTSSDNDKAGAAGYTKERGALRLYVWQNLRPAERMGADRHGRGWMMLCEMLIVIQSSVLAISPSIPHSISRTVMQFCFLVIIKELLNS